MILKDAIPRQPPIEDGPNWMSDLWSAALKTHTSSVDYFNISARNNACITTVRATANTFNTE